jgi:hypothetical protein
MACSYNENSEIYENYILARLSDTEQDGFEAHLKTCKTCQDRLEREKWLQANLREIGKREMKTEIRKQVEMQRSEKKFADRGMILRVAAIVLFVVLTPAIIYYYQYLPVPETQNRIEKPLVVESEELPAPAAGAFRDEGETRRQLKPERQLLGELKKSEKEVEALSSSPRSEKKIAPAEESPLKLDDLVDQEIAEKSFASEDIHGYEGLSGAAVKTEPEPAEDRGISATARSNEADFFRYDSDTPAIEGIEQESIYLRSKTLAESEQYQKTWLFRKATQTIIMRLQLSEAEREKFQGLPQKIPAQVIVEDSLRLTIDCEVTPEFYNIDPDSVIIYQPNLKVLQIQLPQQVIYEIDLTRETQEAVQVRP